MGRLFSLLTHGFTALALSTGMVALAGCGNVYDGVYEGEYHYNEYGTEYGIRVKVEVEKDVITGVSVLPSDFVEATPAEYGWDDSALWSQGRGQLLQKYVGRSVGEVKAEKVPVDNIGAPVTGNVDYDGLIVSGATQSSGRLLLAVQNALK